MSEEALAASALLNREDPTLLTYAEVRDSYGSSLNFFLSFGLKPWNVEDCEEARSISRSLKEDIVYEKKEEGKKLHTKDTARKSTGGRGNRR